jgi:hypothetical protein
VCVCVYVYVSIYIYIYLYLYIYIYIYIQMSVCIYVYVYACVRIYTSKHRHLPPFPLPHPPPSLSPVSHQYVLLSSSFTPSPPPSLLHFFGRPTSRVTPPPLHTSHTPFFLFSFCNALFPFSPFSTPFFLYLYRSLTVLLSATPSFNFHLSLPPSSFIFIVRSLSFSPFTLHPWASSLTSRPSPDSFYCSAGPYDL